MSNDEPENRDQKDEESVFIPQELVDEYMKFRATGIPAAKRFYFESMMPIIRERIEALPEHRSVREIQFDTLVSMMGFSPETTVLSTLVIRPQKLIVAFTDDEKSRDSAKPAIDYLLREGILSPFDISYIGIDAFDPKDIYDKMWEKLSGLQNTILDITGGTKVMSATAGALAWELNLPISYINGSWDPERGAAGLHRVSRLSIKRNPSRTRGFQRRQEALDTYKRGHFIAASEKFLHSRHLIDDNSMDDLGLALCRCYSALVDFDRERLKAGLQELRQTLDSGGVRRLHENRLDFDFNSHLEALDLVAAGDRFATTAAFAELSDIYDLQNRHDLSGFVSYRSMEALVELKLSSLCPDFKMNRPDWKQICRAAKPDLEFKDDQAAVKWLCEQNNKIWDESVTKMPPAISLQSGFRLLCILTDVGKHFRDAGNKKAVGMLMTLAAIRNRSNLAHGHENLSKGDARTLREGARDLAKAIFDDDFAEFEQLRNHLRPRDLGSINP